MHSSSDFLNLLLSQLGNELSSDNNRLLWKVTLTQNLEVSKLSDVNDRSLGRVLGSRKSRGFTQQGPQLVQVDNRHVVVVLLLMEVTHTDLSEVTRVILVEHDSVVMLSTSVTATTRVLSVLTDTTVTGTHVSALMSIAF